METCTVALGVSVLAVLFGAMFGLLGLAVLTPVLQEITHTVRGWLAARRILREERRRARILARWTGGKGARGSRLW